MGYEKKSLKLNFAMNVILTLSNFIFPLISFPYVSRILLPDGTGKVSFATSFINYFSMVALLGIPTYGIRACAKVRDDKNELSKTAHELLCINVVMDIISYSVLIITLICVPRLKCDRTLYLIMSSTIFLSTIGMEWLYKALEQYTYITIRSIIFKFIAMVAMFLLVHDQSDYVLYGGLSILASSASNVFNFINVRKHIYLRPVGSYDIRHHLKPITVFFAMTCATTIYTNLDTVMLGFMTTDADVGYYNAAVKIKIILVSVVTSLGTVLLPHSTYNVEHGYLDVFWKTTKKALNYVFLVATPLMFYFICFAKEGIFFLSGSAYEGSIVPMQVIMPTLLIVGLSNITGIQILVPLGKEKYVLYSEIAGAIVDVIINAFLIPHLTSVGAAIGTLIAELVVLSIQCWALIKNVTDLEGFKDIFRSIKYLNIICGLFLGLLASWWIKGIGIGNFATLVVSAILFFGVYGIFMLLSKEPLLTEIFSQALRKIKMLMLS